MIRQIRPIGQPRDLLLQMPKHQVQVLLLQIAIQQKHQPDQPAHTSSSFSQYGQLHVTCRFTQGGVGTLETGRT